MTTYYLYIKTHTKTGLKYLGHTTKDPFSYNGSGVYWKRHLKTHGTDHHTQILYECNTKEELSKKGLEFSKIHNVVESTDWANLIDESGEGRSGPLSDEHKQNIGRAMTGRKRNSVSPETRQKISDGHKGKKLSEETKRLMSIAKLGKPKSVEHRKNISDSLKGNIPWTKGKTGDKSHMYGVKRSEETRKKISESLKKRSPKEKVD